MSNADLDPGYTITRYDHPSCELVNDWDGRIHGDLADAETELKTELLASIVVWLLIIIVAIVCVLTAFGLLELL